MSRCHKIEQSLQPSREFFISQNSIVEELQVVEAQFNVRRLEMKIEVSAMKSRFSWLINLFRKSFWFDKTWSKVGTWNGHLQDLRFRFLIILMK